MHFRHCHSWIVENICVGSVYSSEVRGFNKVNINTTINNQKQTNMITMNQHRTTNTERLNRRADKE